MRPCMSCKAHGSWRPSWLAATWLSQKGPCEACGAAGVGGWSATWRQRQQPSPRGRAGRRSGRAALRCSCGCGPPASPLPGRKIAPARTPHPPRSRCGLGGCASTPKALEHTQPPGRRLPGRCGHARERAHAHSCWLLAHPRELRSVLPVACKVARARRGAAGRQGGGGAALCRPALTSGEGLC